MSIETEVTIETEPVAEIDDLRQEIDRLDAEILAAVKRRTEVSRIIGKARMASGGTRLVHSREMKVIERYSELGPEGKDLAMLLLRLGRGRSATDFVRRLQVSHVITHEIATCGARPRATASASSPLPGLGADRPSAS